MKGLCCAVVWPNHFVFFFVVFPGLLAEWSTQYLNNVTAKKPEALGAFTFHGYDHGSPTVAAVAAMAGAEVDASRIFFASVVAMHAATKSTSKLWITETAWTAGAPQGAPGGGAKAAIDGMCRASDMAWNLGALGSAAEVGVDVFCRGRLRLLVFVCAPLVSRQRLSRVLRSVC